MLRVLELKLKYAVPEEMERDTDTNKVNRVNAAAPQDFRLIYLSGCLSCGGLDSDARFQSGREYLHVL